MIKSHHNLKAMNKVTVQLIKNFKSLLFNCDVTDGIKLYTHDIQHCPELIKESTAQTVNLE